MIPVYRILHVEDSPDDAELVGYALRAAAFKPVITRIETEREYVAELDAVAPDLIICDYDLPRFSALRALQILEERGLDVPFILVSHHIGESAAVLAMQQGAGDYLPKSDLGRLAKAIESALDRCRVRRGKARAEALLRHSESIQRAILNSLMPRIALLDGEGTVVAVNKAWDQFDTAQTAMGVPISAAGANYLRALEEAKAHGCRFAVDIAGGIKAVMSGSEKAFSTEYPLRVGSSTRWFVARATPLEAGEKGAVVSHQDVTDRMLSHIALDDAHRRLKALSKRTLSIQEEERRVISRELHDDVGQTLSALKIGLHRLAQDRVPDRAILVSECLAKSDAALERLRELALDLRPPQLDQLGLGEALACLAERQRIATGVQIQCRFEGLEDLRPPVDIESACYRIAQEALNNATRHAEAKNIVVSVEADDHVLKLAIRDDGIGFDSDAAAQRSLKTGSMGLISMEERAQLAGGRLKLRSVLGGGTTVSAIFAFEGHAGTGELEIATVSA